MTNGLFPRGFAPASRSKSSAACVGYSRFRGAHKKRRQAQRLRFHGSPTAKLPACPDLEAASPKGRARHADGSKSLLAGKILAGPRALHPAVRGKVAE